jgi:hypothetical protein
MWSDEEIKAAARAIFYAKFPTGDWSRDVYGAAKKEYYSAARAALNAVPRWRPISEAPKDGTPVDLWCDGRRWTDMEWNSTSPSNPDGAWKPEGASWKEELSWMRPTHWMPLPEPPTND